MKLALAPLFFAAPAMAFAPSASFGAMSALRMSTETETEEKVRNRRILCKNYSSLKKRKSRLNKNPRL